MFWQVEKIRDVLGGLKGIVIIEQSLEISQMHEEHGFSMRITISAEFMNHQLVETFKLMANFRGTSLWLSNKRVTRRNTHPIAKLETAQTRMVIVCIAHNRYCHEIQF